MRWWMFGLGAEMGGSMDITETSGERCCIVRRCWCKGGAL